MLSFPKQRPARDESYRRFVASLPCAYCGIESYSQCAHADEGKGMGIKASDYDTFPLCAPRLGVPGCHYLIGQSALLSKDERRQFEEEAIARTRTAAREAGVRMKEAA